ncbi:MAG: dihydroorotase [Bacteroidota bacterium]
MDILLESIKIIDSKSPYHNETVNLLIQDGFIKEISRKKIDFSGQVFNCKDCFASLGWVDLWADFCEPGFEEKEDISTGLKSAFTGGMTHIGLIPDTNPLRNNTGQIDFVRSKSSDSVTDVSPYSLITKNPESRDLVDLYDIHNYGVRVFSNGYHRISSDVLNKALLYSASRDTLIIQRAVSDLDLQASMHEGYISTTLGMKSQPSLNEYSKVESDISTLEYAGGHLHISQVSCKESILKIRRAKDKGLNITCDVSIAHLLYVDEHLVDFDTNFKVSPPFRTEEDRQALIDGLKDDTIDAIVSAHRPQDVESKLTDFQQASFGMITLPIFPSMLLSLSDVLDISKLIEKVSYNPRSILKLESNSIKEREKAVLTIINPKLEWEFGLSSNPSKSSNSPYFNKSIKGKAVGLVNGSKYEMQF